MINGEFVPQPAPSNSTKEPQQLASPSLSAVVGYSSAHAQHAQHTKKWSQLAYRGSVGASSPHILNANLEVYEPDFDKKRQPICIPVRPAFN